MRTDKQKLYNKLYYLNHRDHLISYGKNYYKSHHKEKLEYQDDYNKNSPIAKQWKKDNKPQIAKKNKIYQQGHRERARRLRKLEYKNNVSYRLNCAISNSIRRSLKKNKGRHHWEKLVEWTLEEFKTYIESKWTYGMNWENYGEPNGPCSGWHIDHIRPKNSFNITSIDCEDFKKCWSLNNLQPLWSTTRIINGVEYLGNINKKDKYKKEVICG